jgi:hypothetical protein
MTMEKSRVKTMFIVFFDAQGVIHREFVPEGQTVNGQFYLGVMERLLKRIRRVRPEFHNSKEWFILHDSTPAHIGCAFSRKKRSNSASPSPPTRQIWLQRTSFCFPN